MQQFITKLYDFFDRSISEMIKYDPVAYAINIYDGYAIEIIGTDSYSEDDPDWPCDERCSASERLLKMDPKDHEPVIGAQRCDNESEWERIMKFIMDVVRDYIKSKTTGGNELLRIGKLGLGFVNGDCYVYDFEAEGWKIID